MGKAIPNKFSPQFLVSTAIVSALFAGTVVYLWQRGLDASITNPSKTDEEQIREVVSAKCEAEVGYKASIQKVDINGDFAYVGTSCYKGSPEGSGFGGILKKTNGIWTVIYQNQQSPGRNVCPKYGLPSTSCVQDYESIGY